MASVFILNPHLAPSTPRAAHPLEVLCPVAPIDTVPFLPLHVSPVETTFARHPCPLSGRLPSLSWQPHDFEQYPTFYDSTCYPQDIPMPEMVTPFRCLSLFSEDGYSDNLLRIEATHSWCYVGWGLRQAIQTRITVSTDL